MNCGTPDSQVEAPHAVQFAATADQTLIFRNGIKIVGSCTPIGAQVQVQFVSDSLNVVSDSRTVSRGQTLSGGSVAIGGTLPSTAIDRGDFDIVNKSTGASLNGSFYAVFIANASTCQFNISAMASAP